MRACGIKSLYIHHIFIMTRLKIWRAKVFLTYKVLHTLRQYVIT